VPAVFLVKRGMWSHHGGGFWCFWDLLGVSLVRTMAVVVPHIGPKNPLQMAPIYDQEVVEALRPDRSHEPLGVGIGIRGAKRRSEYPSASVSEDSVEARDILGVSVTEEELDLDALVFKLAGDVPCLLGDPGPVRMGGHRGVQTRRRSSSIKKST